jgi:HSP20 family protein
MTTLQREMNDLFDRFFGGRSGELLEPFGGFGGTFFPLTNISETSDNVIVTAEVAGIDPKDIDISVTGDVLTVKGEKRQEKETKEEAWHRVERSYGSFERTFRLPSAVVVDKVAADYKNGVLRITLPKTEESKRREVKIRVS